MAGKQEVELKPGHMEDFSLNAALLGGGIRRRIQMNNDERESSHNEAAHYGNASLSSRVRHILLFSFHMMFLLLGPFVFFGFFCCFFGGVLLFSSAAARSSGKSDSTSQFLTFNENTGGELDWEKTSLTLVLTGPPPETLRTLPRRKYIKQAKPKLIKVSF